MSVTTPRPRRETVRAEILVAAEAALLRHGYDGTTVSDIAAAAGFTKGAVYSNFGGKPELLAAVCAAHIDAIVTSVTASFAEDDSTSGAAPTDRPAVAPADAARRLARTLTEQITGSPAWPALWVEFRTLATREPSVCAAYTDLRLRLCEDLQERLRTHADTLGLDNDSDQEVAATLLLTVAHGLALDHAAAPEAVPATLIENTLIRLLEGLR